MRNDRIEAFLASFVVYICQSDSDFVPLFIIDIGGERVHAIRVCVYPCRAVLATFDRSRFVRGPCRFVARGFVDGADELGGG